MIEVADKVGRKRRAPVAARSRINHLSHAAAASLDAVTAMTYGRPPKASQFKKGQSGNPRGRPRKTPGRRAIAARVLGEMQRLSGQPRGTRVRYTTLEIIVMTLKQLTAAGQARTASLYMRFAERYGDQETAHHQIGYAVVPERLTEEEWVARYSPKDRPPEPEEDD